MSSNDLYIRANDRINGFSGGEDLTSPANVVDSFSLDKSMRPSVYPIFDYLYAIMKNKNDQLSIEINEEDARKDLKPIVVSKAMLQYILSGGSINLLPMGLISKIRKTKIDGQPGKIEIELKRDVALKIVVTKELAEEVFDKKVPFDLTITVQIRKKISFDYDTQTAPADYVVLRKPLVLLNDRAWEGFKLFNFQAKTNILTDSFLVNCFAKGQLSEINLQIKDKQKELVALMTESGVGEIERSKGLGAPARVSLRLWSGLINHKEKKCDMEFVWDLSSAIDERVIEGGDINFHHDGDGYWPLTRLRGQLVQDLKLYGFAD